MAYGEQQGNLKRTAGVVRKAGSLPALKQSVYQNWKLSTLGQMMDAMKPAYQGQAKSLAQSMFPSPAPINIVPGGGPRETKYDSTTGTVNIGERLKPTIPLAAYAHEQSHALQRGPGAQWDDTNFTESERASANELAPTLAGNLAEYEARRRSGGQALNAPTPLAGNYQPSLEWMRQQASQHGVFGGKPMEQLLAENPQFVRMLAERAGQGQQPAYESGSLTPSTADSFEGGNQMAQKAFGRPVRFGPTAAPGFGPGEYAEYQRSIGVNTNPPPVAADPDTVRAVQGIVGASPARQERLAMAEGARPTVFVDGQGYMPLGGYGPRSTTGISAGRTPFPGRSVGAGRMSSGVTTGGAFGSPLMLGQGPGGESPTRQPFVYKPGRGPTITSPGGQSDVVSPEAFQQTWNQMSGNARGGALRMALADQRERAAADPRIAANIARNEAAIQRQTGGAPAPGTNPLFDRERQRKELTKAGMARPMAAMFANLHGNPEAQAALAEQMASEETERIQSYNQPFGSRTATGGRGDRGGMGVAGVVGAQERARENAAKQKYDNDLLQLEQIKAQWGPRLQIAEAALAPGSTATPAEKRAAQKTIDEYNRFTDSTFGGRQVMPPSQTGTQQPGQPGTNTSAPIPPEYVPYGSSGIMADPQVMSQLEATAANYSANPAGVGAQLVQALNEQFPDMDVNQKEALLRELTGNPSATLANPAAKPMSGTEIGANSARVIGSGRQGTPMTPHLVSPW